MPNQFANALKSAQRPANLAGRSATPRNGRKHIGGYFDPAVSKQLRMMAVEEDSSVQRLLEEALDLLFQARAARPRTD